MERPLAHFLKTLSDTELDEQHYSIISLLQNPGMKIENEVALDALCRKGAAVDLQGETVRFPPEPIEETLAVVRTEEEKRFAGGTAIEKADGALTFSWHTPFRARTPDVTVNLGGVCPQYYEHSACATCTVRADDYLYMVHLAEGVPELGTVGNAGRFPKKSELVS